jgi:hypothetical protein
MKWLLTKDQLSACDITLYVLEFLGIFVAEFDILKGAFLQLRARRPTFRSFDHSDPAERRVDRKKVNQRQRLRVEKKIKFAETSFPTPRL